MSVAATIESKLTAALQPERLKVVDESDLLAATAADEAGFRAPVRDFMASRLETVSPATPIPRLLPLLNALW